MSAELKFVDTNVLVYLFDDKSSRRAGTGLAVDGCQRSRWLLTSSSPMSGQGLYQIPARHEEGTQHPRDRLGAIQALRS